MAEAIAPGPFQHLAFSQRTTFLRIKAAKLIIPLF
jgi:hypothetical protein